MPDLPNTHPEDPRDQASTASLALGGLRTLIHLVPYDEDIPANAIGPLVDLIHDRLEPAVVDLQAYVSRNSTGGH
jgi:hypothetical protein